MKPIATEWVQKAEADFATLQRESQVSIEPNYDGVCFHAQQCIEKYMKALLTEQSIGFTKIHDLTALLDLLDDPKSVLEQHRIDLAYLSDFAVSYRYPGESADQEFAKEAFEKCLTVRNVIRNILFVD